MPQLGSTNPLTVSARIAEVLSGHTRQAFGLMGNGNAHLIDALTAHGVAMTTVRHEAGTVAAADAYTRVSGKIAIATTTYGAGFTNALTALAEAARARTPMLVVVGDAPNSGPRMWDVDQDMLTAALGIRLYSLSPTGIAETVARAVATAERARRPVVLAIPYDLANAVVPAPAAPVVASTEIDLSDPELWRSLSAAPAETTHRPPAESSRRAAAATADTPADLSAALDALSGAVRPLVLAGRGAWLAGASAELGQIADTLGALTASTALGRGIFPDERYDLGITGGFGQEAAMAAAAAADVVLVVGASLNQFTMRFGELFGPGTTVIRVDLDQVASPKTAHPIAHLLLQGDAQAVVRALNEALQGARPAPSGWRESVAAELVPGGALRVQDDGRAVHPDGVCADGRLDPRSVAARIAELLPADRHVTTDGGHFIGWSNMFWPVSSPERSIMVGTAYQTIGLGFPTVAGIAAASPDTTVVLATGDGGGLMALADLETAIRTANRCIIVVFNDGAYGAEVHLYGRMGLDQTPMLIPDVDFAGLASALGATGVRVDQLDDLAALAEWTAAGGTGTILLDCRVSRTVVAPYQEEILRANGVA